VAELKPDLIFKINLDKLGENNFEIRANIRRSVAELKPDAAPVISFKIKMRDEPLHSLV
jgi:hypothetical protein